MSVDKGTSPPDQLPDALAGLPRPSGAPEDLLSLSKDFGHAADQLEDIGTDLVRLLLQVSDRWEGEAEVTFQNYLRPRTKAGRVVAAGYRQAGTAIRGYAAALEHAQQTFTASRRLEEGDRFRQLGSTHTAPLDMFSTDRVRARSQLESALEQLTASTVRTNSALKALEATLGPRPPVKPEIYRSMGESLMQGGSEVKEKAAADLNDIWDLHRLVTPGEAKAAWKERVDNYVEMFTDPGSYFGDEAYDSADVEEAMAGNDARWAGGVAYTVATGNSFKYFRWLTGGKHRQHEKQA